MAQGYRKRGSLYVAALLLTATLGATPAQAGPVFEPAVQLEGYGAGQNVTVYYNGADHTVFAGQYQAHYSGPGPWPAAGQFWTFTTDVGNWAAPGASYGVGVNSTDGLNQGGSIGWLFNHLGGDQLHSNVLAAGIQLALWDLAIDGGDGLWNGDFRYTGADVIALQAAILLDEAKHQHEKGIWLKSNGDGPSVLYRKD
ncbi:MAG: hypothetical protein JNM56_38075, partial [Planctomycetia bacterium]|nr:hypothetical protein [Planctomycetia bacterium]